MKDLSVHITPHGIELSLALRKFIQRKISRLSRFAGDIVGAEVVLRERSGADGLFSVSARLALPGRDIHGNAVHENFYTAVNQLVARLARLSRKRKTRYEKHVRRAAKFQFASRTRMAELRKQRRAAPRESLTESAIMILRPSMAGR
jgi:ribosomal subunit interface protein